MTSRVSFEISLWDDLNLKGCRRSAKEFGLPGDEEVPLRKNAWATV